MPASMVEKFLLVGLLAVAAGCANTVPAKQADSGATIGLADHYNARALAELDEAVALASELRYVQAEAKLKDLLAAFQSAQDHRRAGETMFWLGYCSEKQGRIDEARDFYDRLVKGYPDTQACRQARSRLAILQARPASQPAGPPAPAPSVGGP